MINFFDTPTNVPISELERISVLNNDSLFLISQTCNTTQSGYISKYVKYEDLVNKLTETLEIKQIQDEIDILEDTYFTKDNFIQNHLSVDINNPWIPNGFRYDVVFNETDKRYEAGIYELKGFRLSTGMNSEFTKIAPTNTSDTISDIISSIVETRKEVQTGSDYHIAGTTDSCGNLKSIKTTSMFDVIHKQLSSEKIEANDDNYITRIQTKGGRITYHDVNSLFNQVGSVKYCDISRKTINDIDLSCHNLKIMKCKENQFEELSSTNNFEPDCLYLTVNDDYVIPDYCTVTFISEKGNPPISYKVVQRWFKISDLPTVTYPDLTFGYWVTEDGQRVDEDFIVTEDITLYSHEVATITFASNIATNSMQSQIVELCTLTQLNENILTSNQFDFQGWVYLKNSTSNDDMKIGTTMTTCIDGIYRQNIDINRLFNFVMHDSAILYSDKQHISVDHNIILRPVWLEKVITIKSIADPYAFGTVKQSNPTYYDKNTRAYRYNEDVSLTATVNNTNYIFTGWSLKSDRENIIDSNTKITVKALENRTYVANFKTKTVQVTFKRILNGDEKIVKTVTKNRYQKYGTVNIDAKVTGYVWDNVWKDENGNELTKDTIISEPITYYATGYVGETKLFKNNSSLYTYTVPETCTKLKFIVAGADGNYIDDESMGIRHTLDECEHYIDEEDNVDCYYGEMDWDNSDPSTASYLYGTGSLVAGTLKVSPGQKLYIYVGSKVKNPSSNDLTSRYNASDIRLSNKSISSDIGMKSRIVTAAGGGNGHFITKKITTGDFKNAQLSFLVLRGREDTNFASLATLTQDLKYMVKCNFNNEISYPARVDPYLDVYPNQSPIYIRDYANVEDESPIYQYGIEELGGFSLGDIGWSYSEADEDYSNFYIEDEFQNCPQGSYFWKYYLPGYDDHEETEKEYEQEEQEQENCSKSYSGRIGLGGYRPSSSSNNLSGLNGGAGIVGAGAGYYGNNKTSENIGIFVSPTQGGKSGVDNFSQYNSDDYDLPYAIAYEIFPKYYTNIDIDTDYFRNVYTENENIMDGFEPFEKFHKKYDFAYVPFPENFEQFKGNGFVMLKPEWSTTYPGEVNNDDE